MVRRAALIVVIALTLSGCAEPRPAPMPVPSVSPSPSASASAPVVEDTSATGKKPLFDETNAATIAAAEGASPGGEAFIDGLINAGFDVAAMQVTPDKTAINLDADNVQFSVLVEGECLVGQYGNVGYQSTILPALSTGLCLIGNTRPINW